MSKKTNPITAAKNLLERSGYSVKKKRDDPKIGDVIRFYDGCSDPYNVLITFHQTKPDNADDVWDFGGVIVSEGLYEDMNSDACWIDRNEWARDDGQYTVIGHIDLSKALTPTQR